LAAIVKATLPFPPPDAPDVIVSQDALLDAVHVQPLAALTAIVVPVPPLAAAVCDVGLIVYAHACDWVTLKVCPAIVSVPVRCAPVLAAIVKATLPFPPPDAPDVIVSQDALLDAVQVQPLAALTAIVVPVPPLAAAVCDVGVIVYEHACDWVTLKVCPAIVSVPVRCAPVLADALKATVPPPVPVPPLVTVSHEALLTAVHVHAAVVVTVIAVPAPPVAPIVPLWGAIEYEHAGGAGAAACVIDAWRPAITRSPVRAFPVFGAAVNSTLPFPLPEAPAVTVSHDASLEAVHVQSAAVVTPIAVPAPPPAPMFWLDGAIV
jgi:hypothetical protein